MNLTGSIDAIWGVLGVVLSGIVFWMVNRRVLAMQATAAQNLAKILEAQVTVLTSERDDYRTKLHHEKELHQATSLRVAELESRPDLTSLTVLLTDQKNWMRALGDNLREHSESDAAIFTELRTSLQSIATSLKNVANNNH